MTFVTLLRTWACYVRHIITFTINVKNTISMFLDVITSTVLKGLTLEWWYILFYFKKIQLKAKAK